MTEAWKFRSGTLDHGIFNHVVLFNEYQLPDRFAPDDIVIDVGAHIGSFAEAVLSRGCRNVTCIEPDQSNFELAAKPEIACRQRLRAAHAGRGVAVRSQHRPTLF